VPRLQDPEGGGSRQCPPHWDKAEALHEEAKGEQAAGDRHYWPIYNLDIRNPNAQEAESHDPDCCWRNTSGC